MSKKTVLLGASTNPERYAFKAIHALAKNEYEVIPVGIKEGEVAGIPIQTGTPAIKDVHTVTLYLGAEKQNTMQDYIFSLSPKRIIFNPGTENPQLEKAAKEKGIQTEQACTLMLLSTGQYERK